MNTTAVDVETTATPAHAGKNTLIATWVAQVIVVAIFAMGAIPKFTGGAALLVEKLGSELVVYGIGAAELLAIVLILVPKTAVYGAIFASLIMLGAIGSHVVGPVGMEGDAGGMFPMAIVAFLAAATTVVLRRHQLPFGN